MNGRDLDRALIAAGILALWVAFCVGEIGRAPARSALTCARYSIGTDQAIADCYTSRGLPVPGDL